MPGECRGPLPEQDRDARFSVTGAFPDRTSERVTLDGTMTIANATNRRIDGLAASQPDVYVLQHGRIVATPLPRDDVGLVLELDPRQARVFAAKASLRRCSDRQPLEPGRYELRAVLDLGDASAIGGPWPLQID